MPVKPTAFFLPADGGQRFCLFYAAQGDELRGLMLYIHPFGEEMNKTRRMAALQARALAQAGYSVLQFDLKGCGDSSGDFADATWHNWVSDVVWAAHWLRNHCNSPGAGPGAAPLWLWGLRAGCLLAVEAAKQLNDARLFLFWQPPAAGKQLLQQFLRLKVAGDMLGGRAKGAMENLHQQLAAGSPVEIAGYLLSSGLALGLEQAALLPPPARATQSQRMLWFELSTRQDASLSPISGQTIGQWQQSGFDVASQIVSGPAFWQTTEIEEAPALIAATTAAVCA